MLGLGSLHDLAIRLLNNVEKEESLNKFLTIASTWDVERLREVLPSISWQ